VLNQPGELAFWIAPLTVIALIWGMAPARRAFHAAPRPFVAELQGTWVRECDEDLEDVHPSRVTIRHDRLVLVQTKARGRAIVRTFALRPIDHR
jgi:hypothetical protein